jgi:D-alanyl-D-alanine carboxypeptidase
MTSRRLTAFGSTGILVTVAVLVLGRGGVAALGEYGPARTVEVALHRLAGPGTGDLRAQLEHHVRSTPGVPGAALSATSPRNGLHFNAAAGRLSFGGSSLHTRDGFRTASVTKPLTAAATLRLVEDGRLKLDQPVGPLLPPELAGRLRPSAAQVTLRQLLNHTSGLRDYAADPRWLATVATHPQRRWTPTALVDVAFAAGDPHGPPGGAFHYSDTGYVLLGLILEQVTRRPLADAYRELLPMHRLPATFLEGSERPTAQARAGHRAHQYVGPVDFTRFNPTFDAFGGGGLASTARDLDRFVRALFTGGVFRSPVTLRTMLSTVPAGAGRRYGLGIGYRHLAGEEVWFHEGFFGAFLAFVPRLDLSLGGSVNQNRGNIERLLTATIKTSRDRLVLARAARSGGRDDHRTCRSRSASEWADDHAGAVAGGIEAVGFARDPEAVVAFGACGGREAQVGAAVGVNGEGAGAHASFASHEPQLVDLAGPEGGELGFELDLGAGVRGGERRRAERVADAGGRGERHAAVTGGRRGEVAGDGQHRHAGRRTGQAARQRDPPPPTAGGWPPTTSGGSVRLEVALGGEAGEHRALQPR